MQNEERKKMFKKAVLAGAFAAAGVVLSVVSIPMGPTKCFPFQHTINVLAGILLGPWWAVGAAFTTSVIRNMMGTGSLFAFPGSMFGALFVGLAARALPERYKLCAACELARPAYLRRIAPGVEKRARHFPPDDWPCAGE